MESVESEEPMKEDIEHNEVPKTKNRDEMTIEELEQENQSIQRQIEAAKELLEQKRKEELINSIKKGQQELKELKESLARLGLSLDD